MRYNLKDYYKEFSVFEVNKLPARAYFIPFDLKKDLEATNYLTERYNSDCVQVLSGEWDFFYCDKISKLKGFIETDTLKFDKIKVPSTWQRTGYENPWYLNSRYAFKLDPPNFPTDIPIGIYRKEFLINSKNKDYVISFLGCCATIELHVNGDFVGYSEGSHNTAEFDITKYLQNGLNEILVIAHKYCNGTYLECQDMFRENGIFRDVLIFSRDNTYIRDFSTKTKYENGVYSLDFDVFVENYDNNYTVNFELIANNGLIIAQNEQKLSDKTNFSFKNLIVDEWSAEIPNLYTAYVTLKYKGDEQETFRTFIGFKHIEIRGEVFYFNNENIKIKGVNHHDTDAENGWVMSISELLRDAEIIKEYNCNAVRMSHYPPDPIFITMCDVIGLYVIDEMDIECHGIYSHPLRQLYGLISNNLNWQGHFLDRAKRMFYRDRNHPSIILWSLGNESGGYKCHDLCYDFFKRESDIPVHYEGVIHTKRHSYDVISEMYPHSDKVERIGKRIFDVKYTGKPYILCEYAHAMGVGPGGLDEYMRIFYAYDNIMGGCIWEFCDHAVYHKEGQYKYTYGGDHNEPKHDGNFCVDGLFFPDRTPSTGALNMREVFRPIRAMRLADNQYRFTNTNRFLSSVYLEISYDLMKNGEIIESGDLDIFIKPKQSVDVTINHSLTDSENDYFIIFNYCDKQGNYVACEQIVISEVQYKIAQTTDTKIIAKEEKNIIIMQFKNGSAVFDKGTGEFVSYNFDGVEMLNTSPLLGKRGFLPNFYRGEIDNDRFIKILWKTLGYNKASAELKACDVNIGNTVKIISKYDIRGLGKIASCEVGFDIDSNGVINITAGLKKSLKLSFYNDIPRFGLTLELAKEFDLIEYYGMGDRETLSDFDQHGIMGIYETKVGQMGENYIYPQECGNRTRVRYAKVTNKDGFGIQIIHKNNYLNFNASHYVLKDIINAKHIEDLIERDTTNLQIDGFYRGAGSQSCGQGPLEKHKPNLSEMLKFEFQIAPICPMK